MSAARTASEFTTTFELTDLSPSARRRLELAVVDLVAVCHAGRTAPAARIAAETAQTIFGTGRCTAWLDGRQLSPGAAAWANGVLANVLDLDDGHSLTKGHPGAAVIPAAIAVGEHLKASAVEVLTAIAVGYEVAVRAAIAQHDRSPQYHGTGSWGSVGAAAAAARLLGSDEAACRHAISLAEYHGPLALIMRSVAQPAMTKDGIGWGAMVGVASAMLADSGFTSTTGEFAGLRLTDWDERRVVEELYLKPFPCCRWAQSAVVAATTITATQTFDPAKITAIEIRTFEAAAALADGTPADTEQAQYSLVWPVACQLGLGRYGVAEALGDFDNPTVNRLLPLIDVVVDPDLTAEFPARRLSSIVVRTDDGTEFSSGITEPWGEGDDPQWEHRSLAKARRLLGPSPTWPTAFTSTGLGCVLSATLSDEEKSGDQTRARS
ncbi:MmgE/PrpD family protein [soil metagenome]